MIERCIRWSLDLLGLWLARAHADGWLALDDADGAVIWPQEVERALRQRLQPSQALALPEDASMQTADDLWQTLWEQVEAKAHEDLAAERWHDLITRLQISPFEGQVLAWLCAMAVDLPTCRAWRYGWADIMQPLPTWGFASHMLRATARGAVSAPNPDALPILSGGLVHLSAPSSMPNAPHGERVK